MSRLTALAEIVLPAHTVCLQTFYRAKREHHTALD